MTMERASEIVARLVSCKEMDLAIELFCRFEETLNPHDPKSDRGANWQEMFAGMCGFEVARKATPL